MSNKTQLQTNNTQYASLIELLRGKVVGGGSVETCTVTITSYQPSSVSYVNNEQVVTEEISGTKTITVTKNTILAVSVGWSSMSSASGDCELLFYAMASAAYSISGNCTLISDDGPVAL